MYKAKNIFLLSDFELLENEPETPPHKANTISRKLTNSFFDNNSFTILKRENCNLANGNNNLNVPQNNLGGTSIQLHFKTLEDKKAWKALVKQAMFVQN